MSNFFTISAFVFSAYFFSLNLSLSAQIGNRVALNYSYFSFSKDIKEKNDRMNNPNIGFEFGLFTTLKIIDKLNLEPFLNFTKYGNTVDLKDGYSGTHNFYNLHFCLLSKYEISTKSQRKFAIFAGPNIGLGLGRPNFKFCAPSGCEKIKSSYANKNVYDYQLWNFGAILGTEYNLTRKVKVDIRYIKYFNNLYHLSNLYRTNSISIGISYNYF